MYRKAEVEQDRLDDLASDDALENPSLMKL